MQCNLFVANDAPAWNCLGEGGLLLYANPEAQSVFIKVSRHFLTVVPNKWTEGNETASDRRKEDFKKSKFFGH